MCRHQAWKGQNGGPSTLTYIMNLVINEKSRLDLKLHKCLEYKRDARTLLRLIKKLCIIMSYVL